jgi:chromatin assembly factor 1 subunit A
MPLYELSTNIQESEATGRKRSHDEFAGEDGGVQASEDVKLPLSTLEQTNGDCCEYGLTVCPYLY